MDQLDFTSLRLFASVVELGNIAQASRVNHIAASAISKRISDLEDRVGAPLIYRLRDGVVPTDAGATLYKHVLGLNAAMAMLKADLSEHASGMRGLIKLWANTSAVTQFLPEDLKAYADTSPNVKIDLREETSKNIVEAIRSGEIDIGIYSSHVECSDISKRVYRRDTLMVIVPVGHDLAGHDTLTLRETVNYDHIGLQSGSSLQDKIVEIALAAELPIRVRVRVFGFEGVRRMVEARLGIAIVPLGTVIPHLESRTFVAIKLNEPWAQRTLYLGFRDYKTQSLAARQMIEILAPAMQVKDQGEE